jgi:2',3'-cyclic-nucleotide 2'-phosphodiesterase (5'-nucleotidase family)
VGLINIEVGKERPYKLDGSLIPPYKLPPPDPEVAALVKHWEDQVSSKVDINIGEAREKLSQAQLKKLIEEAIRARSSADLGYYNQGGIRASLNKGPVSARDIWNIEPFGNNIVIATLRGDKIGGALLRSLRESKFPIKADKLYRVATNNYVTGDPGRFIGKPENSVDTGISVRDTIIEHIRKHGTDTNKL